MEHDSRKKNPKGVELQLAQDGASRGPRRAPGLRSLGWEAESWVKWEEVPESPEDDTVLTHTL
jgi:hypothetical protein